MLGLLYYIFIICQQNSQNFHYRSKIFFITAAGIKIHPIKSAIASRVIKNEIPV